MGKEIAHVRPLILPHAEDIGVLIERIEAGGKFEVVADKGERGSFTVRVKEHAKWPDEPIGPFALRRTEISNIECDFGL